MKKISSAQADVSPYADLPSRQFWRSGVGEQHPLSIGDLYVKKYDIGQNDSIITAGSCFAQHIATHMRRSGYKVLDTEPAPAFLRDDIAKLYGYRLYSGRYGNIYTVRQLLQLIQEVYGLRQQSAIAWSKGKLFVDALRPSVEPEGLSSREEVSIHRSAHLKSVRKLFAQADVFIFTMGLTEAWISKECGTALPTAPGTIAGSFDRKFYEFKNFSYGEIYEDFVEIRRLLKQFNPKIRFLLTVSPVPLTATASKEHVLQASTYSKSVLRAVAGQLYHSFEDIDYFPSYEIIASHFSRGFFYEPNLRSVSAAGVDNVMRIFFSQHKKLSEAEADVPMTSKSERKARRSNDARKNQDVVCEEALLEAFAK